MTGEEVGSISYEAISARNSGRARLSIRRAEGMEIAATPTTDGTGLSPWVTAAE